MNKSITNFRKCAYCPHHNDQAKCCCRKSLKILQNKKKSKNKSLKIANESSIQFVDQNFNELNLNFAPIVAQNSRLKYQNKNLKDNLLSLSYCINQQKAPYKQYLNISTSTTLKTQSQQNLSDRLYLSNKNLQQAIFRIDSLSKQNKQLNERNCKLNSQIEALKLQNSQLNQDILSLKKQIRKEQNKLTHIQDKNSFNEQVKIYRQKYQTIKFQNYNLLQEVQQLKKIIKNFQNKKSQNMSPEWVAQTSNKLSFIQQKIQVAENRLKNPLYDNQNQTRIMNSNNHKNIEMNSQTINNLAYSQIIKNLKQNLALSINTIHSKTRKFNSIFDNIGNINNVSMTQLLFTLIQGFVEASFTQNNSFQKQINRRITVLQKIMDNLLGKLQNLILSIKNKELRNRSTSRSRILLSNKSGCKSKSPLIRKIQKENIYSISNIDRSQ